MAKLMRDTTPQDLQIGLLKLPCCLGMAAIVGCTAKEGGVPYDSNHVTFCNAEIGVELAAPPCEYGEAAPAVRYRLRLTHDKDPMCTPSQLEVLGVFLARDLKALGLIEASRADDLQRHWNAVVR